MRINLFQARNEGVQHRTPSFDLLCLSIRRCDGEALGSRILAGLLGVRTPMIVAVLTRGPSKFTLECTAERRFRFISDLGGYLRDAPRCPFEPPRCELKPPTRQIRHRWL